MSLNRKYASNDLITYGLDPQQSVVVEACAGSGKTWLLVSRILRALLAGTAPGEILAITFTRKAAAEIEARLRTWLSFLARESDSKVIEFLKERGLSDTEAQANLSRARGLFEQVLYAPTAMTITTFHGWFARLLSAAPIETGLRGARLAQGGEALLARAWANLAQACATAPQQPVTQSLLWLYAQVGGYALRRLVSNILSRQAEWLAWIEQASASLPRALQQLADDLKVDSNSVEEDLYVAFFSDIGRTDLQEYAGLLGRNLDKDQAFANLLIDALACDDLRIAFGQVQEILLTQSGTPRSRKSSKAQIGRLGVHGEQRLLELHAKYAEEVLTLVSAQQNRAAYFLNFHVMHVAEAIVKQWRELKEVRGEVDFSDLELYADRLLRDATHGPWLAARLDARYTQILLDEFQDTNPLQWRILRAWLDTYSATDSDRPSLFVVGDPKQSIYRFRRAEPRLFTQASNFLQQRFAAHILYNDATRRNAAPLVDVINALFSDQPDFSGFRPQQALRAPLPSQLEILPLISSAVVDEGELNVTETILRNPLLEAAVEQEDIRYKQLAQQLITRLREVIGRWPVQDKEGHQRPARWGDVMILARRSQPFAQLEQVLRAENIPYLSRGRGGLLACLEVQDVLALLRLLANPADNLALAHVLRTPIFTLSDEELMQVFCARSSSNEAGWQKLIRLAATSEGQPTHAISRAAQYLQAWRIAAQHLPVHDILDRIFAEGDVLKRYKMRVPPQRWGSVRANFAVLFELSLEIESGRYPSLPRFLSELKRLEVDSDLAPSEGQIQADAKEVTEGRINLLTIHAAKGLEAPIVWLFDANYLNRAHDSYGALLDWPPDADAPKHFSLIGSIKELGNARSTLYEAEKVAAAREDMNLLYVAITRAEQYFFASGCTNRIQSDKFSHYQFIQQALIKLGAEEGYGGGAEFTNQSSVQIQLNLDTGLPSRERQFSNSPLTPVGVRVTASEESRGQVFGREVHAYLEARSANWPLPRVNPEAQAAAERLFASPLVKRFFDKDQYVWAKNELAFVLPNGEQGRIDRLVYDGKHVWILDYKTGQPDPLQMQSYRQQLSYYVAAMRAIYPHQNIRSALLLNDGQMLEINDVMQ